MPASLFKSLATLDTRLLRFTLERSAIQGKLVIPVPITPGVALTAWVLRNPLSDK